MAESGIQPPDGVPSHVWEVIGFEVGRLLHGWGISSDDSPEEIALLDPHATVELPPKNPTELSAWALQEGSGEPMPTDPAELYSRVARVCAMSALALATMPHPCELGLDATVYDGLFDEAT